MDISGITPFSLIDYPGKTSCIVFTPGCNMRCHYCHNSEFVLPEKLKNVYKNLINEYSFFNFLEKRKGLLDGVSICGGEPTIHNDLKKFCKKIKEKGFLVKLDTNGRDPNIIKELIEEKLVDYIAMDIKNEYGKMSEVAGVNINEDTYIKSINIIMSSSIDYEFRTTVISGIHNNKNIENISKLISGASYYYLQNFKPGNTLKQNFIGKSFSEKELNDFEMIAKKYINNVGIRN